MSAIKGICSAIKEDKVNEWLENDNRKIEVSGDKWSDEELELFDRQRSDDFNYSVSKGISLEYYLDFSDAKTSDEVAAAASRLLAKKFDISNDWTYITEIIKLACSQSYDIGEEDQIERG